MLDPKAAAELLTDRYGLALKCDLIPDDLGKKFRFYPSEIPATQGFSIEVMVGWRTIETTFLPGNFASSLISQMQGANSQQRTVFRSFIEAAKQNAADLKMTLNGNSADPFSDAAWDQPWRTISFRMETSPQVIDHKDTSTVQSLAVIWAGRMLGLVLALLPIESDVAGEAEGGSVRIESNRYERSTVNRAACIDIQGAVCKCCGLDFGKKYGVIGQGYIEVHHIEPVSGITPGTVVDPAKDLVPLCSNCHAMVHKRKPPLSVAELQALIEHNISSV